MITFSSSLVSSPERTIHHCIKRQMISIQSYLGRNGSGMICVIAKEAKITTGNKQDRACSRPKRTSCFSALMICASIFEWLNSRVDRLSPFDVKYSSLIKLGCLHYFGILKCLQADSPKPYKSPLKLIIESLLPFHF